MSLNDVYASNYILGSEQEAQTYLDSYFADHRFHTLEIHYFQNKVKKTPDNMNRLCPSLTNRIDLQFTRHHFIFISLNVKELFTILLLSLSLSLSLDHKINLVFFEFCYFNFSIALNQLTATFLFHCILNSLGSCSGIFLPYFSTLFIR